MKKDDKSRVSDEKKNKLKKKYHMTVKLPKQRRDETAFNI